ncbi:MAG: hypothetical protein ACYC9Y_14805 [Candidatus Methylomirabilia bacterium]
MYSTIKITVCQEGKVLHDSGGIASAMKEYVDLYGDRTAAFLFDFVFDPERPA